MRVLVVDDDPETRFLVGRTLEREGHGVVLAADAAEARAHVAAGAFDLIVLDVMLPDESGLALCARFRDQGLTTPILCLSARGAVAARVDGLDAGADDYLAKPFAVRELVARVRALGRRGAVLRPRRVQIAGLDVDFTARRIERDGVEVPLTAREWAVFEALFARRGQTLTYEHLLEVAWGEASPSAQASLEVIIGRLRRKLGPGGPSAIRTLRGVGYALVDESP